MIKADYSFDEFLARCRAAKCKDIAAIEAIAYQSIKHYGAAHDQRTLSSQLEKRWYDSLDKKEPDYSVYSDELYVGDLWACFQLYSRRYLNAIQSRKSLMFRSIVDALEPVRCVVDVGCGIGYSTYALKEIFPNATVYGTNVADAPQTRIAQSLAHDFDFTVCALDEIKLQSVDLVFASEYFEHFESPIEHLHEILKKLNPRALLIANAFSQKSIGHFNQYKVPSGVVSNDAVARHFNRAIKFADYTAQKTMLWNNRPTFWQKNQSVSMTLFND